MDREDEGGGARGENGRERPAGTDGEGGVTELLPAAQEPATP